MSNKKTPVPKKGQKVVWMKCRAKHLCEGNHAILVWCRKTPGGGNSSRYRCMACNGVFHISI